MNNLYQGRKNSMADYPWPNLVTMFFEQAEKYGDKPFVWQKIDGHYQSTSWTTAREQVIALAKALRAKGIEKGDRVMLVSENRSDWGIIDLAIMSIGAITVPTYTTNTINDHRHILHNSGARAAIVSTKKLSEPLLHVTHDTPDMAFVLTLEAIDLQQNLSHPIYLWEDFLKEGASLDGDIVAEAAKISIEDTACIIYTSGTGGAPKGVMLHHKSVLHNCHGAKVLLESMGLGDEVFLSFLPLSHSYEHSAGLMFPISIGAQIYYAENTTTLATNMGEAHPTLMAAVPRLYEMMRAKILKGVELQGGTKAKLFYKTLELGLARIKGQKLSLIDKIQDFFLERLVRNKVRARFGGRLKALVSGGGPLNEDVGYFFQALGLRVLQGYGQTESGPVISANVPQKVKMRTVGPVLENTELKIASDGEILVRGDLVMQGYWRNDKATAETIKDGWLHTGDIGVLDDDGYLEITDRKKDIIVNSGGDNIAPQRVEGFLALEGAIAQSMVYGDKQPHLVALIVPDEEFTLQWAKDQGLTLPFEEIVQRDDFHQVIAGVVSTVNKELSNIEKIRKFYLLKEAFSIENEQMTPTMKIRRHVIRERYRVEIQSLYL